MTFDEWWNHLQETNPNLKTCEKMVIRVDEFKRICRRAFEDGNVADFTDPRMRESGFESMIRLAKRQMDSAKRLLKGIKRG